MSPGTSLPDSGDTAGIPSRARTVTRKSFSGDRFSPGVISEESYMRIRVPGRFIAVLAILTAFLCLLPASSNVAVPRPIGWEDVGPVDPNPKVDNDCVVLKGIPASSPTVSAASTGNV